MAQHGGRGDRVPADVWQKDDRTGEWLLKVGKSAYRISDPAVPPSAGRWRRQRAHRQREQVHLALGKGNAASSHTKGQSGKTLPGAAKGAGKAGKNGGGKGITDKGQYKGSSPGPKGGIVYEP